MSQSQSHRQMEAHTHDGLRRRGEIGDGWAGARGTVIGQTLPHRRDIKHYNSINMDDDDWGGHLNNSVCLHYLEIAFLSSSKHSQWPPISQNVYRSTCESPQPVTINISSGRVLQMAKPNQIYCCPCVAFVLLPTCYSFLLFFSCMSVCLPGANGPVFISLCSRGGRTPPNGGRFVLYLPLTVQICDLL